MAKGILPEPVAELFDTALVAELTVVDTTAGPPGCPISYPLIPLYDGEHIFFTSAVLFSRKFAHIRGNPRVAVSLTDPVAMPEAPPHRATVLGTAEVLDEEDPHDAWERLLPLWQAKEPAIGKLVRQRFGLPLFFERHVIQVTPVRVMFWPDGDTARPPRVYELVGS